MCGISGILNLNESADGVSLDYVHRMCDQIVHRGPDDAGYWSEGEVALGMRRLSIIDVDGGSQPIFNEDGSICVVFNGEIFNFLDLRKDLEARGHRFSSRTDTEVLVHLYEEYGPSFPRHLNGMFAIALWDSKQRRLVLARDRLGVKPLFYAVVDGLLVFGSEIKCLHVHDAVSRKIDPQAVYNYCCLGYIPQPRTIYADVRKLPPAHTLVVERGQWQLARYWSLPQFELPVPDRQAMREQLRALVEDAVRIRMISDVPLGAFLSGGLDSSITVAMMARQSSQPVKTFFIDFDGQQHSERQYARAVAQRFATDHHELVVRPDAAGVVDRLVHFFDEPFGDSSAIPTYYLSQLTSQHVTVALAGDGGDESFGGYVRYRHILRRRELRAMRAMLGPLGRWLHGMLPRQALGRRYFRSLGMSNAEFFAVGTQELETQSLLSRDFLASCPSGMMDELDERAINQRTTGHDPLEPFARLDTHVYLPDDILVKVDRMSMAHSIEVRAPFLDYRIVELAAKMPAGWKIAGGDTKVVLKEVFGQDLPPEILQPRKRGFSVPMGTWLREDLRPMLDETIHDPVVARSGFFNVAAIEQMAAEHSSGVRGRAPELWRFMMFARWLHAHQLVAVV